MAEKAPRTVSGRWGAVLVMCLIAGALGFAAFVAVRFRHDSATFSLPPPLPVKAPASAAAPGK